MVQNYGVETDQEEDSSLHMRVEFKLLRRSSSALSAISHNKFSVTGLA